MSTGNVVDATPTPLETPISGGNNDTTQGGNNGASDQQHPGTTSGEQGSGNRRSLSPESGQSRVRTLGNAPVSIAALAACNKPIEDFRASNISKATALSRIYTTLTDALPADPTGVEEAFARYIVILENHEHHLSEAKRRSNRQRSKSPVEEQFDEEELSRPTKRAKPDESQYPWVVSDFIHSVTLSPSPTASLDLLKLYSVDPKGTKRSLINSPTCPEFPDSEWTNILAGRAVNLDTVLTGYYSTSNNDERIESIGDLNIKFGTVAPTKIVSSAGEWTIAWNRASRATSMAFPHRAGELANYAEYIIALFAATDILFHDRVILFDKAVRRRVGSRRDLELTHFDKFADLRTAHMDSIGAAVVQRLPISKVPLTSRKKQEACNRWNEGLCLLDGSQCRRLHVCNKCSKGGHKGPECPSSQ
ncbi:uncharacterized protein LACBIDRAFT_300794 [Laccaria bicolor S238N-H82]|uniref:Predicted protein n=1 Tax=Laccaria bicolor (strain S238N-H82 / ATCC MYA-4686) TaxID=486041 RepID=B0CQJ9_LACBS|nr:uncharacterized protein LACBIDRAFT_300794 [Laccaria bicolor S238N-H82]EDR15657.1 predicted protein [Laccaria bicolor S238N-H82]|eukprot:XP_001873865.1 predicted protein [Laccaria bicolor S238N-H82]